MAQLRCTIKRKDGEYIVRITDIITNKIVTDYFTNDREDAHSTSNLMIQDCESKGDVFVKKP